MLAKSAIEKNSTEEWVATGLYPIRAVSIFCSVSSAMALRRRSEVDNI